MSNKIFDCTTFYNANMLFDLRYHSLKNYVDYFVVCEANKTHTGQYKGYNFDKDSVGFMNYVIIGRDAKNKKILIAEDGYAKMANHYIHPDKEFMVFRYAFTIKH